MKTTFSPRDRTITLLLVEDNLVDALMMKHLLHGPGAHRYDLIRVESLARAESVLAAQPIDCALLDLMLPDAEGLEALERLSKAAPNVPVIVLTAMDDDQLSLSCIDHGAQDYLVKSQIDRNLVTRTIRHAIERQRMVMELRHAYELEQYLSTHDALTALPGRQLLLDRLQQAAASCQRLGTRMALLFVDINRFKKVNDLLGHQAGDRLLQEVARRLSGCLRNSDTVARYGGDEFVILASHLERPEDVEPIAQKILGAMGQAFRAEHHEFCISLSIGIAIYPQHGLTPELLLQRADQAMFQAKKYGGNMYLYYSPHLAREAEDQVGTENSLQLALKREEFLLEYQPQFDLADHRIVGAEALVRWRHPQRGVVLPTHFIPCAEQTGLILPLGEWVCRSVCREYRSWRDRGMTPIRVAINLSPRQFRQENLAERMRREMEEAGIEPEHIEVEVTESSLMHHVEKSVATLKALKELGIRISVDDFGTGYSSLCCLKRLPVDCIKIDREFTADIHRSLTDVAIVRSIFPWLRI